MKCIGIAPITRASSLLDAGATHVVPDFRSLSYSKLWKLFSNGEKSNPSSALLSA